MKFLNVGWITFLILVLSIFIVIEGNAKELTLLIAIGYIGAVIGNSLRLYAMPDAYYTSGFWDSIKKRFFWNHSPQIIGFFLSMFLFVKFFGETLSLKGILD